MLILGSLTDSIGKSLYYLLLQVDGFIYSVISYIYQIFLFIAEAKVFNDADFLRFSSRIYLIIGIIMLFVIAVSLLNAIVDPDKGKKNTSGIAEKIVTTIVLLALCPTAFNYLYKFQNIVVSKGVIGDIVLGEEALDNKIDTCNGDDSYASNDAFGDYDNASYIGNSISTDIFKVFFHPSYSSESRSATDALEIVSSTSSTETLNVDDTIVVDASKISNKDGITAAAATEGAKNGFLAGAAAGVGAGVVGMAAFSWTGPVALLIGGAISGVGALVGGIYGALTADTSNALTLCDAYQLSQTFGAFQYYKYFATNVFDGDISYIWGISTIVGVGIIYLFLSFCIDLGVRAIKLGYYQLIAPIPILLRIVPNADKVFSTWLKKLMSTYFELFIRLFIVYIGIYFITNLPDVSDSMWSSANLVGASFGVKNFARLFIIIGIFIFMKQAPKLIGEVLGIDTGSMKLGIADKLGEMAIVGNTAKRTVDSAKGAVTGAAGGLSTGLFNKDVSTLAAVKSGAARGAKTGGNQFIAQRKKVFENKYGYNAEQGLFGGKSIRQKVADNYGKVDEQSWKERTNRKVEGKIMEADVVNARRTAFTEEAIKQRKTAMNIANDPIFEQARVKAEEYRAAERDAGRDLSPIEFDRVRRQYLNQIADTTTNEKTRRKIHTYFSDENLKTLHRNYQRALDAFNAAHAADPFSQATGEAQYAAEQAMQELASAQSAANNGLISGNISREADGSLDRLYTKDFENDSSFVQNGPKTQSDSDKITDALKKLKIK